MDTKKRNAIEQAYIKELVQAGRLAEVGTPAFERSLAQRYIASNVATPSDYGTAQQGAYQDLRKAARDLDAYMLDNLASDPKTVPLIGTDKHDEMRQYAFEAAGLPYPADLKRKQRKAAQRSDPDDNAFAYDQLTGRRKAVQRDLENEYAKDPAKRPLIGGDKFKKELRDRYEAAGVHTAADNPRPLGGLGTGRYLTYGAGIAGFHGAVSGGQELGLGIAAFAGGLNKAVQGAASGFEQVGQTILGLILGPLGKSGQSISKIFSGLGNSFISLTRAGGSIAVAGLRAGLVFAGGLVGGVAAVGGGLLGALVGTAAGVGPVVGASLGLAITGGVLKVIGGIVGTVGGAVGSMFSAIGEAVGQLGNGIAETISNIANVLSDLVKTGKDFANSAMSIQRGSGMSLGASSGVASLSRLLTGGDTAFNGTFSNYGMIGAYGGQRAQSEGLNVGANADFLSIVAAGQTRYNQLGNSMEGTIRRKQMLSVIAPGSEGVLGDLYSKGLGGAAVKIARQTAPTGAELRQDALTGFKLDVITRQLDNVKFKLLNDLMPVINLFANAFSKVFSKNEGKIVKSLEKLGEWLYVRLPSLIEAGLNSVFKLGQSFATNLPQIAKVGLDILAGMIQEFQSIAKELGGSLLIRSLSPTLAKGLTDFGNMNLDPWQIGMNKDDQELMHKAALRRQQAQWLQNGIDGSGYQGPTDWRKTLGANDSNPNEAPKVVKARLLAEADQYQQQAQAHGGLLPMINNASANLGKFLADQQKALPANYLGMAGTQTSRQANWNEMIKTGQIKGVPVDVHVHVTHEDNPDSLVKLKTEVTTHVAHQYARAVARASV